MKAEKQLPKGISEIVGTLTDPIIVYPGGWGDTLPEWLKTAITMDRLIMNMDSIKGGEPTGTDAEACAYLHTASLSAPPDHDWAQIYLYVAGRTMRKWNKGQELPVDIVVEKLDDNQLRELARLKQWLYRTRTQARQDKDRAERRDAKEAEKTRRELKQPALFDL